jgi:shikimate kinase
LCYHRRMAKSAGERPIVLGGMPGAGKTTVGRIMAPQLGRVFQDGDDGIEEMAGISMAEIFRIEGEPGFRLWEKRFYLSVILPPYTVLAVGGGALMDGEVRTRLENEGTVVCLRVDPRVAWWRLRRDYPRPLLAGDGLARLQELAQKRAAHYDSFPLQVDTTELTPDEVADKIIKLLKLE